MAGNGWRERVAQGWRRLSFERIGTKCMGCSLGRTFYISHTGPFSILQRAPKTWRRPWVDGVDTWTASIGVQLINLQLIMNLIHLINETGLKSMVILFPLSPVSSFLVFIIIWFCHVVNLSEFLDDGKNVPAFTLQQGYGQHYKTPSHTPRVLTQNQRHDNRKHYYIATS
jgi:hypothetical protein